MNLRSCNICGLVYDIDVLDFPSDEEICDAGERGEMDDFAEWDGDQFVPISKCRVCHGNIMGDV